MSQSKKLVLGSGQEFHGLSAGFDGEAVGELVFNTSMVGYQEILSDPAYAGQIVVMTYPLMGQYGICDDDFESRAGAPAGVVVRECCTSPSNFRYTETLTEYLEEKGVPCLSGVDTRMITSIIRDGGHLTAAIVDESVKTADAVAKIKAFRTDRDIVSKVSCTKRWFSRTPRHRYDVVVLDCGVKHGTVAALNRCGCNVTVVPFDTAAEDIMAFNPSGLLVAGGPGCAEDLPGVIATIRSLRGKLPIFGTGLGHSLISLAYGARLVRFGCGHHGGRPVRSLADGSIVTAEHNHNFTTDPESIEGTPLKVTYVDVADGSIEGLECAEDRVRSVHFNPEGGPGSCETVFFEDFVNLM